MDDNTYSLRVALRRSDGQMVAWAWDDIPHERVGDEVDEAVGVLRAFRETSCPEEELAEDWRALFAWQHRGWGLREPRETEHH